MSRGYTTTTLVCFCALSFIFGRFIQEIPGLPQTKSGVCSNAVNAVSQAQAALAMTSKVATQLLKTMQSIHFLGHAQFTQSGNAANKASRRQAIEKVAEQQIRASQSGKPQVCLCSVLSQCNTIMI